MMDIHVSETGPGWAEAVQRTREQPSWVAWPYTHSDLLIVPLKNSPFQVASPATQDSLPLPQQP